MVSYLKNEVKIKIYKRGKILGNPANLNLDWAELDVLFRKQILNDPQNLFLSFIFSFLFTFLTMKLLRPIPPHFCHIIIHL
jgi:hypothetical protein